MSTPEDDLPPKPDLPDCCNSGCAQCVMDDYAEAMRQWREECAAIRAARPPATDAHADVNADANTPKPG